MVRLSDSPKPPARSTNWSKVGEMLGKKQQLLADLRQKQRWERPSVSQRLDGVQPNRPIPDDDLPDTEPEFDTDREIRPGLAACVLDRPRATCDGYTHRRRCFNRRTWRWFWGVFEKCPVWSQELDIESDLAHSGPAEKPKTASRFRPS